MAHQSHRLRITAKALNIPSNPSQGLSLIFQSEIPWTIIIARTQEPENVQSILDSHQNHISFHKIIRTKVRRICIAEPKSSAMEINHHRQQRFLPQRWSKDVQIQTIFIASDLIWIISEWVRLNAMTPWIRSIVGGSPIRKRTRCLNGGI